MTSNKNLLSASLLFNFLLCICYGCALSLPDISMKSELVHSDKEFEQGGKNPHQNVENRKPQEYDQHQRTKRSVESSTSCQPLWFNKCLVNSECCSGNCQREQSSWQYGVCKNKNKNQVADFNSENSESKTCQDLWFNECVKDQDCCSKNCHRESTWRYGVCKRKTGATEESPSNNMHSVSFKEFSDAVTSSGYPAPRRDQFDHFNRGLPMSQVVGSNSNWKREAAMMLAQIIHETGGLQFIEEIRCAQNPGSCQHDYQTAGCDRPGKRYHGRGYLQLTWCRNYLAAGEDLGLGNQLVGNPDLVVRDEKMAWDVSFSYWKRIVHNSPGVSEGRFGATTKAINGPLECRPKRSIRNSWDGLNLRWRERRSLGRSGKNSLANTRFQIYTKVYRAFNLSGEPDPRGCSS